MKRINLKQLFAGVMALGLSLSLTAPIASAAEVPEATIHTDRTCNLTIYKYDFTNAAKDGVWSTSSYTSTGRYDANVNEILGNAVRKGANSTTSALGNGETSNGYALKGVEYTYMKVADVYQFSESDADGRIDSRVEVLYAFDKNKAADLLTAIGLPNGAESDANANALPGNEANWYYRSDVINKALATALNTNSTTVKNALEKYIRTGGIVMPLTDNNGRSIATNLPAGLYLLVETKVPEMVTSTTNPFFVSLPMTSVNGGGDGQNGNNTTVTDGGHEWLYDVTIYPKNETGLTTLEKTVREAQKDGGKHNGSDVITDGFTHAATGSAGDTMEYQIISTLPTITSQATALSTYNFYDTVCEGLSYNKALKDVKLEFFTDKNCTDKVATWTQNDGKFTVTYSSDDRHMTIDVTKAGLDEINGNTSNINGNLYAGYSNYTVRVTYTATINSNANTAFGNAGNGNKVVLTWKRTSSDFYDTLIDDAHVFTFGIDITKLFSDVDSQTAENKEMFKHVKFKIWNETDKHWVTATRNDAEGVYYVNGHVTEEADATVFYPVTCDGQFGQVMIKGCEDDEYVITEVETADGYTLLAKDIHVIITSADDASHPCDIYSQDTLGVIQNDPHYSFNGGMDLKLNNIPQKHLAHNYLTASATVDGKKVTMLEDKTSANAIAPLSVVNTRGFDLPQTGDTAAKWLPIAGAVFLGSGLMIIGLVVLPYCRKKQGK